MSEVRHLLPKSERRAQVLRAAAAAFAGAGFEATSMEDVAAAAGVTKVIVYRHFDSKEDLYRSVLEETSARMREEFVRAVSRPEGGGGPVQALLTVARENPDGYRLLVFHAPREGQFEKQAFAYWEEAVQNVDDLLGAQVRDPSVRLWVVESFMGYLLHSVLMWLETGDPADDDRFIVAANDGLLALRDAWTT